MEDNKFIKIVYTFVIAGMLALFVGFAINSFYQAPAYPTYPEYPVTTDSESLTPQQQEEQKRHDAELKAYDVKFKAYENEMKNHNRNVSLFSLAAAVVFMAVSVLADRRGRVLADGLLFGGVATLMYSLVMSAMASQPRYSFHVVSVGLAAVLVLGYHRFGAKSLKTSKKQ